LTAIGYSPHLDRPQGRQQPAGSRRVTGAGAGSSGTGNGRFRLQVDWQTKASYATWEAAEKSGTGDQERASDASSRAIYDGVERVNKIIELP